MEKFTDTDRGRGAAADGEHRYRQGHSGALPQDHQALRPRRASVRHAALRQRGQGAAGLRAQPGAVPPRADPHRAREFRLRVLARARALGAARFRHPLRHRAGLRRHLLQQLLQERHPADPPAARGLRPADRGREAGRQRAHHRRSRAPGRGPPERRGNPLRHRPVPQAPAAERPRRHRPDAAARAPRSTTYETRQREQSCPGCRPPTA